MVIDVATAQKIIDALEQTLKLSDEAFDWEAMRALLLFYGGKSESKVDLYMETDRRLDRKLSGDKSGLSVVGTRLRDVLRDPGRKRPALVLLQQEGSKALNWSGYKFWWPVLAAPEVGEPCVFASKVAT